MKQRLLAACCAAVLALAVAARLHNAWASPLLAGYDSFGHFTQIWFVADTGRFPLATHGWSFFHPPLYYGFMAAVWKAMAASDPALRLKVGKVLIAALGCVHGAVAWWVVRRSLRGSASGNSPGSLRVAFLATALVMLVPVQLYSAGFLGNEGLHAVTGSLSILALLRVLDRPTSRRAALLGLCLGLAMLAKYSAVAIVAAAMVTVAADALVRRRLGDGLRVLTVSSAVLLLVCGPYYARNIAAYGTPFQLSRDTFMVRYVEGNQPQVARGWSDYLKFDPLIFRRPVWPREATAGDFSLAVRESVWTGLYANTWFDGFGGWVLPHVVESEGARRAGQALLTLGLVPTLLMMLGAWSALTGLRRRGWDDTAAAMASMTGAMLVLFVYGTGQAPIAAAVKATYFTPISVAFGFWFARGLAFVAERRPRWNVAIDGLCALLGGLSLAVFWQGFLFNTEVLGLTMPNFQEAKATQYGVVEYAGGNLVEARRAFEQASASNYHLAWENLAFLAIDEGKTREGLKLLRRAAALQPEQLDGGPIGRDHFLALAEAEYDHSIAVVLYGRQRVQKAENLWTRAIARDPEHAEALYCLTLSRLDSGLRETRDPAEKRAVMDEAVRGLTNVTTLDPGLEAGWVLLAAVEAARGNCEAAKRVLASWQALPWWVERRFPAETGTGAGFSASIGRRRLIEPKLASIEPEKALRDCGVETE